MINVYRQMLRLDPTIHKAHHPKAKLGGYPGLALTAQQISEYIPKCHTFIEPFAGLGRVSKYVNSDKLVLNDKSEYALNFLKNNFTARITSLDFADCIRLYADDKNAFFFIDPPWDARIYRNNDLSYCDRKPIEYYRKIFDLLKSVRGDWMLCGDWRENSTRKMLSKSGYPMKIFVSKKKIFGFHARTRVISNRPFVKNNQKK